jgi:hypothetical protein
VPRRRRCAPQRTSLKCGCRAYRGVWHAFTTTLRTEGAAALYSGLIPTSQRAAVIGLLTLPTYDSAKYWLTTDRNDGFAARLEQVLRRLREDWTGVSAAADPTDDLTWRRSMAFRDGAAVHLLASFWSSLVSVAGSQPFDVVKTRLMNQPFDPSTKQPLLYRSAVHCARVTVRDEGLSALWKGSVATMCRSAPWLVVFWVSYEHGKAWLTGQPPPGTVK